MTLLLPHGPYAGVNGPLLRTAAGKLADMGSANLYDLAVVLGVSPAEARSTWEQLVAEGFIDVRLERALPTARMDDLARARFGKPLPRKKADTLVNKAVSTAEALNALPPEAPFFWVTRVAVFGSYLDTRKLELGDLDIAWEVEERPGVRDHVHSAIVYNFDGLQTTRAQFRPKGPYVRLTSMHEMLQLKCPYQVVYTFESDELTKARAERVVERKKAQSFLKSYPQLLGFKGE